MAPWISMVMELPPANQGQQPADPMMGYLRKHSEFRMGQVVAHVFLGKADNILGKNTETDNKQVFSCPPRRYGSSTPSTKGRAPL